MTETEELRKQVIEYRIRLRRYYLMKWLIAVFVLCVLLSGCGITRHKGRIEIFDAAGESKGSYVATLDRPMLMEVVDPNGIVVKVDSRGQSGFGDFLKGMMEIITLGLIMDR